MENCGRFPVPRWAVFVVGMFTTWQGKLTPVGQHIAPEKVYLHALMPPAFLGQRQDHRFG